MELFAYLVTKRGVSAGTEELCDILWPGSILDRKQYLWKNRVEWKVYGKLFHLARENET